MSLSVIMDATPFGGGHGGRGIGTAVRGIVDGLRTLDVDDRPALLVRRDAPVPDGFDAVAIPSVRWPLGRVNIPDPSPGFGARRALRGHEFRVFHATQPDVAPPRAAVAVETCWDLTPLRYPADFLDGPRRTLERGAYRSYLRRLRRAERVIVTAQAVAEDVVARVGVDASRVRVVPLAVNPPVVEGHPTTRTPPYVLYSGALEPHKNVDVLIYALHLSPDRDLRLEMTGMWSRRRLDALRRLIARVGVEDRVFLHGHVPTAHLDALRADATAVAVPSLSEGFGLPALEAMAAGIPVITSTDATLMEVTAGAAAAVDPHDPAAWAEAFAALVDNPEARQEAQTRGRARAADFSWRATAQALVGVYREVSV